MKKTFGYRKTALHVLMVIMMLLFAGNVHAQKWVMILRKPDSRVFVNKMVIPDKYGYRVFVMFSFDTPAARRDIRTYYGIKRTPYFEITGFIFNGTWTKMAQAIDNLLDANGKKIYSNQSSRLEWRYVDGYVEKKIAHIARKYYNEQ